TMGEHTTNTQRSWNYRNRDDGRGPAGNGNSSSPTKDNRTRCLPLSSIFYHLPGMVHGASFAKAEPIVHRPSSIARRPYKGQASIIIGLSIFLLILVVGLAVDGGAVY